MVTLERPPVAAVRPEPGPGTPYRVLIVDSHPIVRLGLRASLEGDGGFKVVAEAEDGDEALTYAQRYQPHVVLLETKLQGRRSGFEVARALRTLVQEVRILVLSSHASLSYVRDMIDAGVDGYLLKDARPAEIVDSLRTVVTARQVFSGRVREALGPAWNQVGNGGLTRRQLDVLQRVADGHVNQEIASSMGISVKAVQVHLSGIYSRLGARTRTEAVVMAAKKGLVEIAG
jgi:two-component system nitrate/nitrite response regulator NarP